MKIDRLDGSVVLTPDEIASLRDDSDPRGSDLFIELLNLADSLPGDEDDAEVEIYSTESPAPVGRIVGGSVEWKEE